MIKERRKGKRSRGGESERTKMKVVEKGWTDKFTSDEGGDATASQPHPIAESQWLMKGGWGDAFTHQLTVSV